MPADSARRRFLKSLALAPLFPALVQTAPAPPPLLVRYAAIVVPTRTAVAPPIGYDFDQQATDWHRRHPPGLA